MQSATWHDGVKMVMVDYDGGDGGLLMVWVRSTLKTAYHDASSDPVYTQ